ncbi:MAG: hypothetical protein LAP87_14790 [Acidobacteriia bacterium]|nr:hypothetical protein [Terriglobia bacterium]
MKDHEEARAEHAAVMKDHEQLLRGHASFLKEFEDNMTVIVGIQRQQAAVIKESTEWHDQMRRLHEQRMAVFDEKMLEIEEKLNGLIRFVDDGPRRPPLQ